MVMDTWCFYLILKETRKVNHFQGTSSTVLQYSVESKTKDLSTFGGSTTTEVERPNWIIFKNLLNFFENISQSLMF